MKDKSTTPENAISRRHFLVSASLATAALGFEPLAGMGVPVYENPSRTDSAGKLCLWYDRPAETWMTEALPIGNGPMGAMLFGGTEIERVQFNEISLWAGTRMAVEGRDDEGQDAACERLSIPLPSLFSRRGNDRAGPVCQDHPGAARGICQEPDDRSAARSLVLSIWPVSADQLFAAGVFARQSSRSLERQQ